MSFLDRVAGHSLKDRLRSSVTREELGVEPLLSDAPGTPPSGGVPSMSRLPEELEAVSGERVVRVSLLRQLPPRPGPESADKNGWMGLGLIIVIWIFYASTGSYWSQPNKVVQM